MHKTCFLCDVAFWASGAHASLNLLDRVALEPIPRHPHAKPISTQVGPTLQPCLQLPEGAWPWFVRSLCQELLLDTSTALYPTSTHLSWASHGLRCLTPASGLHPLMGQLHSCCILSENLGCGFPKSSILF